MTCEDYKKIYESKKGTVQDALDMIHSGDVIWCSNNYNEPETLFGHLHEIADRVDNVIVYKSRIGRYPFMMTPGMNGHINCHNYFYGPSYREAHKLLNASFIPVDLPNYYRMVNRHKPCNIFTAQVSPMTEDGKLYVGMNQTIEYYAIKDAVEQHKKIIVEVNPNLTYMNGSAYIPVEAVTLLYEVNTPEYCIGPVTTTPEEDKIGEMVASLIEDGDTIQMGIGGIPDTVGKHLMDKHDLGLHTEMLTNSIVDLMEAGVLNNRKKNFHNGRCICTFALGTQELYDMVDDNPGVEFYSGSYVNDPRIIGQNDHFISVNSGLAVDLTGQVCSESIGSRMYSGTGGQNDFAEGASYSKGGRSVICVKATKKNNTISSIVAQHATGSVVTLSRNTVDYIITEYGIAPMRGRSVRQRVENLIAVAHPDFRAELRKQADELHLW